MFNSRLEEEIERHQKSFKACVIDEEFLVSPEVDAAYGVIRKQVDSIAEREADVACYFEVHFQIHQFIASNVKGYMRRLFLYL